MRPGIAFSVVHCGLCLAVVGALSAVLGEPLLIPAIGASAYVVFAAPEADVAAPRNVLVGHLVGAGIGWAMLAVFGLRDVPGGLQLAVTWPRIGAAAGALAATIGVLRALDCSHPPAGATTMIVALGLLPRARHVLDFVLAGAVVAAYALCACRAAGVDYPLWSRRAARRS